MAVCCVCHNFPVGDDGPSTGDTGVYKYTGSPTNFLARSRAKRGEVELESLPTRSPNQAAVERLNRSFVKWWPAAASHSRGSACKLPVLVGPGPWKQPQKHQKFILRAG